MNGFSLSDLEKIVDERSRAAPQESWTAKLVLGGQSKAAKKLGEEAIETVMAAVMNDRDNLTCEAADLLYHLMVVLKIADIPLENVMGELKKRTVQSGLKEKASRQNS
ncbi:phosphoribosyl-ATP diphosphatase [Rhizobium sp. 2YAF20]|uniref:phosphoribosyl-ATP diphosphatase n=1 Tax=Rhizobium sp. 2YAF20 TaxID=3233027 RepID=UPI003F9CE53D